MQTHYSPLFRREGTRLMQDGIRNADLPNVVEQCSQAYKMDLFF